MVEEIHIKDITTEKSKEKYYNKIIRLYDMEISRLNNNYSNSFFSYGWLQNIPLLEEFKELYNSKEYYDIRVFLFKKELVGFTIFLKKMPNSKKYKSYSHKELFYTRYNKNSKRLLYFDVYIIKKRYRNEKYGKKIFRKLFNIIKKDYENNYFAVVGLAIPNNCYSTIFWLKRGFRILLLNNNVLFKYKPTSHWLYGNRTLYWLPVIKLFDNSIGKNSKTIIQKNNSYLNIKEYPKTYGKLEFIFISTLSENLSLANIIFKINKQTNIANIKNIDKILFNFLKSITLELDQGIEENCREIYLADYNNFTGKVGKDYSIISREMHKKTYSKLKNFLEELFSNLGENDFFSLYEKINFFDFGSTQLENIISQVDKSEFDKKIEYIDFEPAINTNQVIDTNKIYDLLQSDGLNIVFMKNFLSRYYDYKTKTNYNLKQKIIFTEELFDLLENTNSILIIIEPKVNSNNLDPKFLKRKLKEIFSETNIENEIILDDNGDTELENLIKFWYSSWWYVLTTINGYVEYLEKKLCEHTSKSNIKISKCKIPNDNLKEIRCNYLFTIKSNRVLLYKLANCIYKQEIKDFFSNILNIELKEKLIDNYGTNFFLGKEKTRLIDIFDKNQNDNELREVDFIAISLMKVNFSVDKLVDYLKNQFKIGIVLIWEKNTDSFRLINNKYWGEGYIKSLKYLIKYFYESYKVLYNTTNLFLENKADIISINLGEIIRVKKEIHKTSNTHNFIQNKISYFNLLNWIKHLKKDSDLKRDFFYNELLHSKYLRTAIISILVDSFAHNIAAHSLQQILKWLNKRIQYSNSKFKIGSNPELNRKFNDDELRKAIKEDQVKDQDEVKTKINDFNNIDDDELTVSSILWYNGCCVNDLRDSTNILREKLDIKNTDNYWPLSFDVFRYKYLSYINKKATLWSGVIKDSVFGGSITSWFEILYEFCYNPYFIGTIAGSEEIFKVHFRVHCHKREKNCGEGRFHSSCIDSDFMTIDLRRLMGKEGEFIVSGGKKFENIKKELSNKMVFLPGGDAGKHSLYTIFENTLRNVKHCEYKLNREKQIEFNIRINDNNQTKYYNIDIWLSNNSRFSKTCELEKENDKFICDEIKEIDQDLIRVFEVDHNNDSNDAINNFEKTGTEIKIKDSTSSKIKVEYYYDFAKQQNKETNKSIIDENSKPRMGGTFQDKICAAELLTNAFDEVESKYKMNDKDSDNDIQFIEYKKFETKKNPDTFNGCLVTSFKVWKGENLGQIQTGKNFEANYNGLLLDSKGNIVDNLRRYRLFVAESIIEKNDIEALGVIRVVDKSNIEDEKIEKIVDLQNKFEKYYDLWLDKWISTYKKRLIKISSTNKTIGGKKGEDWRIRQATKIDFNSYCNTLELEFTHSKRGRDGALKFRRQGILINNFFDSSGNDLVFPTKHKINVNLKSKEFIETLMTSIYIIDNRMNTRLEYYVEETKDQATNDFMWDNLKLICVDEGNDNNFQDKLRNLFNIDSKTEENIHLLIIHYSYIEKFNCKNLEEFIEQNLKINDKYIFNKCIITTGRGRNCVNIRKLNDNLRGKILFVPPESLTSAVDFGISIRDDFEIKYRLIKLLMN